MIKKIIGTCLLCFLLIAVQAQKTKEEIQKEQQQLKNELITLNKTLGDIKANKKQSLGQLALVQKKIETRQRLINNMNSEIGRLNNDIYQNSLEIYRLKKELDTLKLNYSKSLVFAYKNRSNYDYLNFIFSATSFNDAIKRVAYLKSYRQFRETQVTAITQTQQLMQEKIGMLTNNKTQKNTALKDQNSQLVILEDDKKEKDQVVQQLKGKEKDIAAQIKNRQQTQVKLQAALQAIIRREIETAKKKAEQERIAKLKADAEKQKKLIEDQKKADAAKNASANNNSGKTNATPVPEKVAEKVPEKNNNAVVAVPVTKSNRVYSPFETTTEGLNESINFETNRGRLPWPASSGFVSIHFGKYELSKTLHGVCDGIEISLPAGSNVTSVADGEVSSVFDLGGEQAVIVRHGKYFTTYSHLSSVNVNKGQQIKPGTVIGKAAMGDTGDGMLLFMVANEKGAPLDPEAWLRRR